MEETGIIASPDMFSLAYAKTEFFEAENKSVSKFLYLVRLTENPEVAISWEHSAYTWVPLNELMSTIALRPFYKEAVEYCFSHKLI